MLLKIQHFWRDDWGDVVVPFTCKRCGRCCKELGTGWTLEDIGRAANYLDKEPVEFLKKYLGGREGKDGIDYKRKVSPCPLLNRENNCRIYPVRPSACRLYPLGTVRGAGGVDCPGLKEMEGVIKTLGRDTPHTTTAHFINSGGSGVENLSDFVWNLPVREKWERLKERYLSTNPGGKAANLFLELNEEVRSCILGRGRQVRCDECGR